MNFDLSQLDKLGKPSGQKTSSTLQNKFLAKPQLRPNSSQSARIRASLDISNAAINASQSHAETVRTFEKDPQSKGEPTSQPATKPPSSLPTRKSTKLSPKKTSQTAHDAPSTRPSKQKGSLLNAAAAARMPAAPSTQQTTSPPPSDQTTQRPKPRGRSRKNVPTPSYAGDSLDAIRTAAGLSSEVLIATAPATQRGGGRRAKAPPAASDPASAVQIAAQAAAVAAVTEAAQKMLASSKQQRQQSSSAQQAVPSATEAAKIQTSPRDHGLPPGVPLPAALPALADTAVDAIPSKSIALPPKKKTSSRQSKKKAPRAPQKVTHHHINESKTAAMDIEETGDTAAAAGGGGGGGRSNGGMYGRSDHLGGRFVDGQRKSSRLATALSKERQRQAIMAVTNLSYEEEKFEEFEDEPLQVNDQTVETTTTENGQIISRGGSCGRHRKSSYKKKHVSIADRDLDTENWSLKEIVKWGNARDRKIDRQRREEEKQKAAAAAAASVPSATNPSGVLSTTPGMTNPGTNNTNNKNGEDEEEEEVDDGTSIKIAHPCTKNYTNNSYSHHANNNNSAAAAAAAGGSSVQNPSSPQSMIPAGGSSLASPVSEGLAPQVQFVGGRIVVNVDSLTVPVQQKQVYTVKENGDSGPVNSMTYMKRMSNERWSIEDTELFYRALSQFGTDFTLISHLFPGRLRRHLKNKYTRENKLNPRRVDEALRASAKGTIDSYREMIAMLKESGMNLQDDAPSSHAVTSLGASPGGGQSSGGGGGGGGGTRGASMPAVAAPSPSAIPRLEHDSNDAHAAAAAAAAAAGVDSPSSGMMKWRGGKAARGDAKSNGAKRAAKGHPGVNDGDGRVEKRLKTGVEVGK